MRRTSLAGLLAAALLLTPLGVGVPTASAAPAVSTSVGALDPAEAVIKLEADCTLAAVSASVPLQVVTAILPSRGIYQVASTEPGYVGAVATIVFVARLKLSRCVEYAEADQLVTVGDTRFHSWPDGSPTITQADMRTQAAASSLHLDAAHARSTGRGVVVAVLDTGVDRANPVLAGHLAAGYDYVSDDSDPTDVAAGVDTDGDGRVDGAYGHGTFVAGLALLVAPDATILPMRVLDSDGIGNVFTVAQAITDAVDDGADVVNLSFGTKVNTRSKVLRDAIRYAVSRGAAVVAAAGNSGNDTATYPASQAEVISVAATEPDETTLCSFSSRGSWVDVAAPGRDLVGPLPGGLYATWSGTSMAAPLVSGQVALLDALVAPTAVPDLVLGTADQVAGLGVSRGVVDVVGSLDAAG